MRLELLPARGFLLTSVPSYCFVIACTWAPTQAIFGQGESWRAALSTPSPEFSQMPFWFWNDELDDQEIRRQMADFREHGVYGFVIHARMGLSKSIPFMGERWLHHVRTALDEAAGTGMKVCLYDEGMYPSGSGHGEVVKANPSFAAAGLSVTQVEVRGPSDMPVPVVEEGVEVARFLARPGEKPDGLVPDSVRMIDDGATRVTVPEGRWLYLSIALVPSEGRIRGVHEGEDDRQPDAPAAADLLNPEAMRAFVDICYEPYYRVARDHFGSTVIAMFTDEPSLLGRGGRRGLKPWTRDFDEHFKRYNGYSLVPLLPHLFFNISERTGSIRGDYGEALARRLDETYYEPISRWCEAHGIALTGHPAGATEIRPLRVFQIPGQDLVWRGVVPGKETALEKPNSAMAKCSSSVARHDRRRRNSNEVYGAFGWQLTMEEMKWVADWLMVRGVNLLYPHAFYYSMRDYRAQERPPDVGPNNAWWPHYRPFAEYTARLCGLLTDNRQVCDVAVLGANRDLPWRASKWLQQNQIDFNYLEEWRLLDQLKGENGTLRVGDMVYHILIVDRDAPPTGRLASRIADLEKAGMDVRYCNGTPDETLVAGLPRDIVARPAAPDLRYTHIVKDDMEFYLLVNEGEAAIDTDLTLRRVGKAEWYDAWSDTFHEATVTSHAADQMTVALHLDRRQSLVLCVDSGQEAVVTSRRESDATQPHSIPLAGPWRVTALDGRHIGDKLGDWRDWPDLSAFAGTLIYSSEIDLPAKPDHAYELDLGNVGQFAAVRLNGQPLGVRFWRPFAWDVTRHVRQGSNTLVIEVTNSLVNHYAPKEAQPSGLFGPVKLVRRAVAN